MGPSKSPGHIEWGVGPSKSSGHIEWGWVLLRALDT